MGSQTGRLNPQLAFGVSEWIIINPYTFPLYKLQLEFSL